MKTVQKIGNRYFHCLMLIFLPFSLCTLFTSPSDAASLNDQPAQDIYGTHIVSLIKVAKKKNSIETSSYVQHATLFNLHFKNHFAVNTYNSNSTLKYVQTELLINKEWMTLQLKSILNCRGPPSELFSIVYHNLNTNSAFDFIFILLTLLLSANLFRLESSDNLSSYCIFSNFYSRCTNRKDTFESVHLLRLIGVLHLFIKSNNRLFILSHTSIIKHIYQKEGCYV